MAVGGAIALTGAATANSPLISPPPSVSSCSCYYQQTTRARARARPAVVAAAYSSSSISQLFARCFLSPWTGLHKHLPLTHNRLFHGIKEKKGKLRGKVVYASLFGVGAPEALVIGVVALLVFGPKGLAEVARNLGKTLRAFQPTIRELQDVSREFKSTLEREIGLDEIAPSTNNTYKPTSFSNENEQAIVDPNGTTPKSEPYTSGDLLKLTQEQLAASAAGSQAQESSPQEQQDGVVADAPSKVTASSNPESAAQIRSSEKADKDR